ncbi:MurR/RpiR family transcriptional regulator [Vibrio sinensis]|uniref:MurR/RpiR family transcriptional regulator n=1 Tax=Vibrio sinensis TaxID=2302434 RepID=A0A3A6R1E6_9VIBR|nr:MurR/RpiR family transcriptional regulator [Vibrio sinensis]RJX75124.1 MurR/RpiR family transcriptional regulator [Vibrio sinensis]
MAEKRIKTNVGAIIPTINSVYESLSPAQKKIADFVLESPSEASELSVSELSKVTDSSDASIIRFCRYIGFDGLKDFKAGLGIEIAKLNFDDSILDTDIEPSDESSVVAMKLKSRLDNVISETINLLNFSELDKVAECMSQAKSVAAIGVGSSGITAAQVKHKFMRIGMNVDAFVDGHNMYMKAALMNQGDVLLGISHSGTTNELIKSFKIAKESGVTTVAITHNPRSALAKCADYVLINGNRQSQLQGDSIGTKIAQLFVVDLIYSVLVKTDMTDKMSKKSRTIKVVVK